MTDDIRAESRREFIAKSGPASLASMAALGATPSTSAGQSSAESEKHKLPMRKLGKTGVDVSILGLGGGGAGRNPQIRGTRENPEIRGKAVQILHRALNLGINYFDTCCGYGASESIIGEVAATRRKEMFLATKCFRCHVPGDQLRRELEQSLKLLQTDQIDLWQIHNISNMRHVETIFDEGKAIDVFLKAKEEGLTRFIGITTHSSRQVIEETLIRCKFAGIEMDTILLAFNAFDQSGGGHGKRVLAEHPLVGKIAMKTLAGDGAPIVRRGATTAETALRYVLSHDVATAIVGTHTLEELEENVQAVSDFQPFTEEELHEVEEQAAAVGKPVRVLMS